MDGRQLTDVLPQRFHAIDVGVQIFRPQVPVVALVGGFAGMTSRRLDLRLRYAAGVHLRRRGVAQRIRRSQPDELRAHRSLFEATAGRQPDRLALVVDHVRGDAGRDQRLLVGGLDAVDRKPLEARSASRPIDEALLPLDNAPTGVLQPRRQRRTDWHDGAALLRLLPAGSVEIDPVPFADQAAEDRHYDIEGYGVDLCKLHQGTAKTSIYGRLAENTFKVALIRAIADNPLAPQVKREDLDWAFDVVEYSVNTVLRAIEQRVSDSQAEANLKRILRLISEAGSAGMTHEELGRACGFMGGRRNLQDAIDHLTESEQVVLHSFAREGGGRPRRVYMPG